MRTAGRTEKHANVRDDEEGSTTEAINQESTRHGRNEVPDLQPAVDCRFCVWLYDADACADT